ncbi:hypothetical protein L1987_50505 [Smallanthus sonchifolius]|uniref:Uncharacterized protein n=1 Tax=Smallanthus sonchifolius TaxID=185202 RepID=A0ACB9EN98_9ASTR|nr:hypothetical protein L1987_50505 [Smallanthus sonchifolius]
MFMMAKVSWPKTIKKWFNVKNKTESFHADGFSYEGRDEAWSNNFSEKEVCSIKKGRKTRTERSSKRNVNCLQTNKIDPDLDQVKDVDNYRVFVATWNVAGKSPTNSLNLEDWLHTSPPAHIYVLGFQEIVPLNAGNVLGTEDNGPAKKWLALIRKTLNTLPDGFHTPSPIPDPLTESDFEQPSSHRRSFQSQSQSMRLTETNISIPVQRLDHNRYSVSDRPMFRSDFDNGSSDEENGSDDILHYDPMEEKDLKYCLVASKQMVGIYLTVWVKTDLSDHVRNFNVSCVGRGLMGYLGNKGSISISMSLHQTSFCFICSHLTSGQKDGDELRRNCDVMEIMRKTRFPRDQETGDDNSPQTILEHECDRILWYGNGLHQISYVRGESRFSDHRPVYSVFLAEVESINHTRFKKNISYSSRIEVEELLPFSCRYKAFGFHLPSRNSLAIDKKHIANQKEVIFNWRHQIDLVIEVEMILS